MTNRQIWLLALVTLGTVIAGILYSLAHISVNLTRLIP